MKTEKESCNEINSSEQKGNNSINNLLDIIYDDNFVLMINELSSIIKIYNK